LLELLQTLLDLILHLDTHLSDLFARYGLWLYGIMFAVIFAETGLVVTPFLPGDSLLFALGALAAVDASGTLSPWWFAGLLSAAAILGNTTNYSVGRHLGQYAFSGRFRFINRDYLRRTEEWFARYGSMTIVLSRFVPIVRTFAPFVAGIGRMPYGRFQAYNIFSGLLWVNLFVWGGYLVGNIPLVKQNFGVVTIIVILVSLLPLTAVLLRKDSKEPKAPA
jgi:membrane-associated protein